MARKILLLAALLCAAVFAQDAATYCSSEKQEGENCYRNCCEMLGYTWDSSGERGCLLSDEEYSDVSVQCGYCADSYLACVDNYENGGSGGTSGSSSSGYSSSGGSGCCSGFIVLSVLGMAAIFKKA